MRKVNPTMADDELADLLLELRELAGIVREYQNTEDCPEPTCVEKAADEIERLRAMTDWNSNPPPVTVDWHRDRKSVV